MNSWGASFIFPHLAYIWMRLLSKITSIWMPFLIMSLWMILGFSRSPRLAQTLTIHHCVTFDPFILSLLIELEILYSTPAWCILPTWKSMWLQLHSYMASKTLRASTKLPHLLYICTKLLCMKTVTMPLLTMSLWTALAFSRSPSLAQACHT
jgi:hypothetical protein